MISYGNRNNDEKLKRERYRAEVKKTLTSVVNIVMCAFDGVTFEGTKMTSNMRKSYINEAIREFTRIIKDNIKT